MYEKSKEAFSEQEFPPRSIFQFLIESDLLP